MCYMHLVHIDCFKKQVLLDDLHGFLLLMNISHIRLHGIQKHSVTLLQVLETAMEIKHLSQFFSHLLL